MPSIELNSQIYEYQLNYKKIKRIYIRFKDGLFLVSAPFKTSVKDIELVFKDNAKKLQNLVAKSKVYKPTLEIGSNVSLLGKEYSLSAGVKPLIIDNVVYLQESRKIQDFKLLTTNLLYDYAVGKLKEYHSKIYNNQNYPSLIIKQVSTKLGHYHKNKHQIMLSLNLVYNKVELVDYVIVHELVHIQEFNHQAGFYQLLGYVLPNYRTLEKQLKTLGVVE